MQPIGKTMQETVKLSEMPKNIQNDVIDWYDFNRNKNPPEVFDKETLWRICLEWKGIIGYERELHKLHDDIFKP